MDVRRRRNEDDEELLHRSRPDQGLVFDSYLDLKLSPSDSSLLAFQKNELKETIAKSAQGDDVVYICSNLISHPTPETVRSELWGRVLDTCLGKRLIIDSSDIPEEIKTSFSLKEAPFSLETYFGVPKLGSSDLPSRSEGIHVCHAQMMPSVALTTFDRRVCGRDRVEWLRHLQIHANPTLIPWSVFLLATRFSGEICGFACIRRALSVPKLGPLYATDTETARLLLRGLIESLPEPRVRGLHARVPSSNPAAQILFSEFGLQKCSPPVSRFLSTSDLSLINPLVFATSNMECECV